MHTDLHSTGASFIAHTKDHNPRDLIVDLIRTNPGADRKALFAKWRDMISGDEDYQHAIDWYFFVNMHDYLVTSRNRKPSATERAKREVSRRQQVEGIKARIVEVVLLDLMLPNGKLLRDATFADCAKAGGWFTKIAKKGKPNQVVGKVLSESQLRSVK